MTEEAIANEELEQPEPGAEVELEEPNLEAVQEVEEDAEAAQAVEDVSETEEAKKEEELEDYSSKVQKRIGDLTRKLREAERGRDSALEYAKDIQTENFKLKTTNTNLDKTYLSEAENRLASQKEQTVNALKLAHEAGDYDKIAKAQEVLSKIAVEESKVQDNLKTHETRVVEQTAEMPQRVQQQIRKPSAKTEAWAENNPWFGEDPIMTDAAKTIHEQVIYEGVEPESDEYYNEIDLRMRSYFPKRFEGDQETTEEKAKPQQKVASAGRVDATSSGKRKVKLTPSEVQMAKKLNVPLNEYAKYVKR
tara:strand:- start:3033 stop:3953 length:921 start_codon:yes stop_codon:yes gene_type:complete